MESKKTITGISNFSARIFAIGEFRAAFFRVERAEFACGVEKDDAAFIQDALLFVEEGRQEEPLADEAVRQQVQHLRRDREPREPLLGHHVESELVGEGAREPVVVEEIELHRDLAEPGAPAVPQASEHLLHVVFAHQPEGEANLPQRRVTHVGLADP